MPQTDRNTYIDTAKGITILLVVLGHIASIPGILRVAIFSFHMPLFFMTSGYFIRGYDIRKNFLKSAKNLLIPYGTVCVGSMVIAILKQENGQTISVIVYRYVKAVIAGMSKTGKICTSFDSVWLVWFVCCLFCSRILYVIIMNFSKKYPMGLRVSLICVFAYAGYILGIQRIFLPWSADVALVALIYMFSGEYLSQKQYFEGDIWKVLVLPFVIWILCGFQFNSLELATRDYGNFICTMVMSVSGCMAMIGFSKYVDKLECFIVRLLRWCGRYSIYILAFHLWEMRYFDWSAVYREIGIKEYWLSDFLIHAVCIMLLAYMSECLWQNAKRFLNNLGEEK